MNAEEAKSADDHAEPAKLQDHPTDLGEELIGIKHVEEGKESQPIFLSASLPS